MKINGHIHLTYNQIMKKTMVGGGDFVDYTFRYKKETYTVLVNKDTTYDGEVEYTIVQQTSDPLKRPECVRGEINGHVLYIASIQKFKACVSPSVDARQGIVLTRFLIKLIKKEHPHITSVELTDNASINCDDTKRTKIILSDMMLLTHGHSYYELIGMKPKEKEQKKEYKKMKNIVKNTAWDPSLLTSLLKSLLHNKAIQVPSAGTPFHNAMKYMFSHNCDDMAVVLRSYMKALGLSPSLYGVEYVKTL